MKKYDKIFTDNPFIDELIYFTKTIAVNAVIKDCDKADANETVESLKAADLYIACREGKARFDQFDYDYDFLANTFLFSPANNERYAKYNIAMITDMEKMTESDAKSHQKKIDKLLELKVQEYINTYEESNNYYRALSGLPPTDHSMNDFIYLSQDEIDSMPFPDIGKNIISISDATSLSPYIRIENGITTLGTFYFPEATRGGSYIRLPLTVIPGQEPIITINQEINDLIDYKNLANTSDLAWKHGYYLNESGELENVDDNTIVITNYIPCKLGDVIRIKNAKLNLDYKFGIYDNLPIHEMDNEDLTILYSHNIINELVDQNPDKIYLKYMGDNKIDIYKARKAVPFQILYIPTVSNSELMERWNTKYEQNRMYTLKTYYSEAYKLYSDYYNNFIIVFIILQTMMDIISEVQEFIARRDIFDDRSIRYLFESYGIPYYAEIPRVYQIAMVKNVNDLLKWKASTKNMIDICSLFGFDEVDIFRYYLLRDRRLIQDYDNDKTNDQYQFHYKTIIDENGEEKIVPDNDKNYELKFVRVPIEEKADDYLKDKTAYEDYDIITNQDEFWDGKSDHEDVKSAILDQEFSWTRTKYISIDTMYDLAEMSFDLPYFINIFVDDWLKEDYLYVKIPTIKNNHQFRVADLFVYMMAVTHIYHRFEDKIMAATDSRGNILSILGFNFHVDMHELAYDIFETTAMDINEMKADYFYIPRKQITNFDYLLQLFTKNKEIWNTVKEGMFHADNKRVYTAYKKVYDSCYIQDYTTTFFKLQNGETATTYTDFLKERDYVLYKSIQDLKSYEDDTALRKAIADILIEIVYVLDEYMDSEDFKYVFSKFPAVSGDYVRTYMLKVVNFFKSYKVHLLDISTVYKAFDKRENAIKIYDDWITEVTKEPSDYSHLIEEITADIDLYKQDKISLLENIRFDIERWEFRDLEDKFIFDMKQQIQAILNQLVLSDEVSIKDTYDDHPFAGIDYTYEKDDKAYLIDSIDAEVEKDTKDKYNIFDRIKIIYED